MENIRGRSGIAYEDFQPIADWTNESNSHVLVIDLPGFKKEELKLEMDNNGRLTASGERQQSENRYKRFKQVYSLPINSDINKISGKFDDGLLFVIIPKKENVIEEEPKEQHPVADVPAEVHKQKTSKTEEKPNKGEPKQETTTPEAKPKEDDKDTDVKHDYGNRIREKKKRVESTKNEGKGGLSEGKRWMEEKGFKFGFIESALEIISRNKGVVLAAILGLTVGMYLSDKLL